MANDAERALHHVDLLRLLELTCHRLKVSTARGTHLVRLIQLVNHLHEGQRLLLARTVTGARFLSLLGPLVLCGRSPLGGVAEERLAAARELLLEAIDLEPKAPGVLAARLGQLRNERLEPAEQACVLLLEQQRRLA